MNHGWILVYALILFSYNAASQTTGNFKRKATDLIRFPRKGHVITSLNHITTFSENKLDFRSQKVSSSEIEQSEISLFGMYAFNDMLAVDIKLTQLISYEDKTSYGSASTLDCETRTTERKGFRDPEFGLTYRFKDMSTDNIDINISLNASPKMQDAEDPSTTEKGNAAKGRADYSANVLIGKRSYSFDWAMGIEIEHQGKAETKDVTSGDLTTTEAYTTYDLLGAIKIHAGEVFSLDLGSKLGTIGEYRVTSSDGSFTDYEGVIILSILGRGHFQVGDDVYFSVGLEAAGVGERKLTNSNGSVLRKKEQSIGEFTLGFTAQI